MPKEKLLSEDERVRRDRVRCKKYVAENRDAFNSYQREYRKNRRKDDPEFRAKELAVSKKSVWKSLNKKVKNLPDYESRPSSCSVCEKAGRIVMDHCHNRMEFRGWLCSECNASLGLCKDNPDLMRKLANYIETFSTSGTPC